MLACADINLPRQIQLTLECLVKTSINSPVSELALYKLNLYSPNKVSVALSIRPYVVSHLLGSFGPGSISPETLCLFSAAETRNSFPFCQDSSSVHKSPFTPGYPIVPQSPESHCTPRSQTDQPGPQGVNLV